MKYQNPALRIRTCHVYLAIFLPNPLHRAFRQAIVRLDGGYHHLRPRGSPESHDEYDRLIAECLASGWQSIEAPHTAYEGLLINELLLKFWVEAVQGTFSIQVIS
jgi:hypothetical protein